MRISLAPILLAVELGFLFLLAWRSVNLDRSRSKMLPVYLFFSWVTIYGIITSVLGAQGVYISEGLLKTLPGFWLQVVTVGAVVIPVLLFESIRNGLRHIVDHTPWHWFAYFHGLRIAAMGTAYKTMIGQFPAYFEYAVGVPDFLFGVSAFWIARKAQRGELFHGVPMGYVILPTGEVAFDPDQQARSVVHLIFDKFPI